MRLNLPYLRADKAEAQSGLLKSPSKKQLLQDSKPTKPVSYLSSLVYDENSERRTYFNLFPPGAKTSVDDEQYFHEFRLSLPYL